MDHDLIELAGGEEQSDPQREECLAELGRVIDRLHGRGMSVGTIVAALAISSVRILDRFRT